jgi:hypothetical protein
MPLLTSFISACYCVWFLHFLDIHQFTVRNDETIEYDGQPGGTVFGYGEGVPFGQDWEVEDGTFSLSTDGEKLFLYCEAASGEPRHLMTLSYNGRPYQPPGRLFYGMGDSALPEELRDIGAIVLPHFSNYVYEGPTQANDDVLKAAVVNPDSWTGKTDGRFSIEDARDADAAVLRQEMISSWLGLATVLPVIFVLVC